MSIITLLPFGAVEFNFELGDTEGAPVPGDGSDPFRAFGRLPSVKIERVTRRPSNLAPLSSSPNTTVGLASTVARLPLDDASQMLIEELGLERIEEDTAARRKGERCGRSTGASESITMTPRPSSLPSRTNSGIATVDTWGEARGALGRIGVNCPKRKWNSRPNPYRISCA
jgi:hypothetical protein